MILHLIFAVFSACLPTITPVSASLEPSTRTHTPRQQQEASRNRQDTPLEPSARTHTPRQQQEASRNQRFFFWFFGGNGP